MIKMESTSSQHGQHHIDQQKLCNQFGQHQNHSKFFDTVRNLVNDRNSPYFLNHLRLATDLMKMKNIDKTKNGNCNKMAMTSSSPSEQDLSFLLNATTNNNKNEITSIDSGGIITTRSINNSSFPVPPAVPFPSSIMSQPPFHFGNNAAAAAAPFILKNGAILPSAPAAPGIPTSGFTTPTTQTQQQQQDDDRSNSSGVASSAINFVDQLKDTDVICGQGGTTSLHPGNVRYREVITEMRTNFSDIHIRLNKPNLGHVVVDYVSNYGARFIEFNANIGKFVLLSKQEAVLRTNRFLQSQNDKDDKDKDEDINQNNSNNTMKNNSNTNTAVCAQNAQQTMMMMNGHNHLNNFNNNALIAAATDPNTHPKPWPSNNNFCSINHNHPNNKVNGIHQHQQKQLNSNKQQLAYIDKVNDSDILCGAQVYMYDIPGNRKFHKIAMETIAKKMVLDRTTGKKVIDHYAVAQIVVDKLYNVNNNNDNDNDKDNDNSDNTETNASSTSRFVMRDCETNQFYVLTKAEARSKTYLTLKGKQYQKFYLDIQQHKRDDIISRLKKKQRKKKRQQRKLLELQISKKLMSSSLKKPNKQKQQQEQNKNNIKEKEIISLV